MRTCQCSHSDRRPRHSHSLSQFTGPRGSSRATRPARKDRMHHATLLRLPQRVFLCRLRRDHKKNDCYPDNLKTGYGPSGDVSAFPELCTTPSSIYPFFLHFGPDIVEFARVVRHDRQVELTFPPKLELRRVTQWVVATFTRQTGLFRESTGRSVQAR